MNVRRWKFNFIDSDGCKRYDWIKALSIKHVRAIISSRCKGKQEVKSILSSTDKAHYVRPYGKIMLAVWEGLTTPQSHEMLI